MGFWDWARLTRGFTTSQIQTAQAVKHRLERSTNMPLFTGVLLPFARRARVRAELVGHACAAGSVCRSVRPWAHLRGHRTARMFRFGTWVGGTETDAKKRDSREIAAPPARC
eukprot:4392863-Prymnesium_polylepis.1